MRDPRTLGPWLRRFLADYVVTERRLAGNTQKSYRDSFKLLLPFISAKVRIPVDRLDVEHITPSRVLQFLAHLEENRSLFSADAQPTPDGNPVLRPLRRQS